MPQDPSRPLMIVAVPATATADLIQQGIVTALPDSRGSVLDAIVAVGTDAATVVSLMQGPEAVRAFAEWIRGQFGRSGSSIQVVARRGNRRVKLSVDGDVPVSVVAEFLTAAFDDDGNL